MKRIAIIDGHPDPAPKRLCNSICEAYRAGALEGGHHVDTIRIADLNFGFLQSKHEWEHEDTPQALRPAQDILLAADHWCVVYPLWMGRMPAKLSAFFEQVLRPGIGHVEHDPDAGWTLKLKGKSARVVLTMAMPESVYLAWYRAHSLKAFKRNMLKFIGLSPVRHTVIGGVYQLSDTSVAEELAHIRALGRNAQ